VREGGSDKINFCHVGSVDNSSSVALRPATCSRDPGIVPNAQPYCAERDRAGLYD
jgi:hypothetical protein